MTASTSRESIKQSGIALARLYNQRIVGSALRDPVDVVRWHGAMQAQDFSGAKWAIGLRLPGVTDALIEEACSEGRILRTHVLRPTWHFVTPEDIRWMLELTAPHVNRALGTQYRRMGLDDDVICRSQRVLSRELRGGTHRTRNELIVALKLEGIVTESPGYLILLLRAELDGLICSGPLRGKQLTYGLLDERVPSASRHSRDQALANLTERYFTSHGPATVKDFAWWSGLTIRDIRLGLNLVADSLGHDEIAGAEYWFAAGSGVVTEPCGAHMLPNYDEYIVGYRDRSAYWDDSEVTAQMSRSNPLFNNTIVIDGRIAGTWSRTVKLREVEVHVRLFTTLTHDETNDLEKTLERYGDFVGLPVRRA